MIELLEFIFQGFWHFIGFLILLSVIVGGIVEIFKTYKKSKQPKIIIKEVIKPKENEDVIESEMNYLAAELSRYQKGILF